GRDAQFAAAGPVHAEVGHLAGTGTHAVPRLAEDGGRADVDVGVHGDVHIGRNRDLDGAQVDAEGHGGARSAEVHVGEVQLDGAEVALVGAGDLIDRLRPQLHHTHAAVEPAALADREVTPTERQHQHDPQRDQPAG